MARFSRFHLLDDAQCLIVEQDVGRVVHDLPPRLAGLLRARLV
jgi:hypothetical protein